MKKNIRIMLVCMVIMTICCSAGTIITGSITVQKLLPSEDSWPMFHHDLAHTGYSTSTAPKTNNTAWIQPVSGGITSSPAVVAGRLYIGSHDHNIYCYNTTTGQEIWRFPTYNWVHSSPAVADGKVYVGSGDDHFYCLDANDGHLLWKYLISDGYFVNWVTSSPVVVDGKVYFGSVSCYVYCFDADPDDNGDGVIDENDNDEGRNDPYGAQYDLIWKYRTYDWVESSPAVVDGKVYVGSNDGRLYCLDADTGYFLWKFETGYYLWKTVIGDQGIPWAFMPILSSPTVVNNKVYFSTDDSKVYCVNASTGVKLWQHIVGKGGGSSPAVAYGRVYIGSYDWCVFPPPYDVWGVLTCLDAEKGYQLWNYTTKQLILSSPAIADGNVYVGSFDNHTYCFDAITGRLIWNYTTDGVVRSSPAIVSGKLYIASFHELPDYQHYGTIYCFEDL